MYVRKYLYIIDNTYIIDKNFKILRKNILFQTISFSRIKKIPKKIIFIAKRENNDTNPWIKFGSNQFIFDKWIKEVCGVCCLKMILDSYQIKPTKTLWELTSDLIKIGAFKETIISIKEFTIKSWLYMLKNLD